MADISKPQDTKQFQTPIHAGSAAQDNARADAAVRKTAEAVQQGGRSAGDALRQGAEVTADVTRSGGEAGSEALRRNTQAVADSQRQIVQDAAQKFEEVSRKMAEAAQGTTENVRKLMALPSAAEGGLRDLQQSMTGLVEGVVQTNLRVAQEVFRMSNPAAVVELQQRFLREYMDALLQGSATLARAVRRTADETLRPLEEKKFQNAAE